MIVLRLCAIAAVLAQSSCGPPASKGGFDSANPAAKMYAIEYAARNGDRAAIAQIIEQLQSDDPAVRMLAISTLERLTGQTYGFHNYDSPQLRQEAVDRWKVALQSGALNVTSTASGSTDSSPTTLPPPSTTRSGPQHQPEMPSQDHDEGQHG